MDICHTRSIFGLGTTSFYLLPQDTTTPAQKIELEDSDGVMIHCFVNKPEKVYSGKQVLLTNGQYKNTGFRGIRYSFTLQNNFLSEDLYDKLIQVNNWDGRVYLRPRDDNKKIFLVEPEPFETSEISRIFYAGEGLNSYTIRTMELETQFYDWDDSGLTDPDTYVPTRIVLMGGCTDQTGSFRYVFTNLPIQS